MKTLKLIFTTICIVFAISSVRCQNRSLQVNLSITDEEYRLHHYTFKVYKQNEKRPIQEVYLMDPDSTFFINDLESANYFVQFETIFGTYLYRDLNLVDNNYLALAVDLPPAICCYAIPDHQCPHGHYNKVIRVVYGYPTRFTMSRARYERIQLGGCVVSECNPNFYCKKHDIYF